MKALKQTLIASAIFGITFGTLAFARPSLGSECQSHANAFSEVTVCARADLGSDTIYGYNVLYRDGLVRSGARVLLGGTRTADGRRFPLYEGTLNHAAKPMPTQGHGFAAGQIPGGKRGEILALYFEDGAGALDNRDGANYVFRF